MNRRRFITTTAAAGLGAGLFPGRPRAADPVKIGVLLPFSKAFAVLGENTFAGFMLGAKEALALCEAGEKFDLILCDLMMPIMTGVELHTELSRTAPDQAERMVFLTAGAFTPRARAFLDEVPNARLDKPFELATLRALVQERLGRAPAMP